MATISATSSPVLGSKTSAFKAATPLIRTPEKAGAPMDVSAIGAPFSKLTLPPSLASRTALSKKENATPRVADVSSPAQLFTDQSLIPRQCTSRSHEERERIAFAALPIIRVSPSQTSFTPQNPSPALFPAVSGAASSTRVSEPIVISQTSTPASLRQTPFESRKSLAHTESDKDASLADEESNYEPEKPGSSTVEVLSGDRGPLLVAQPLIYSPLVGAQQEQTEGSCQDASLADDEYEEDEEEVELQKVFSAPDVLLSRSPAGPVQAVSLSYSFSVGAMGLKPLEEQEAQATEEEEAVDKAAQAEEARSVEYLNSALEIMRAQNGDLMTAQRLILKGLEQPIANLFIKEQYLGALLEVIETRKALSSQGMLLSASSPKHLQERKEPLDHKREKSSAGSLSLATGAGAVSAEMEKHASLVQKAKELSESGRHQEVVGHCLAALQRGFKDLPLNAELRYFFARSRFFLTKDSDKLRKDLGVAYEYAKKDRDFGGRLYGLEGIAFSLPVDLFINQDKTIKYLQKAINYTTNPLYKAEALFYYAQVLGNTPSVNVEEIQDSLCAALGLLKDANDCPMRTSLLVEAHFALSLYQKEWLDTKKQLLIALSFDCRDFKLVKDLLGAFFISMELNERVNAPDVDD